MKLENYNANYKPETAMHKEEVDVITEVVKKVLTQVHPSTTTGSFLLVGQKEGEAQPAKEILRFDFEGGAVKCRNLDKPSCWVTNCVVEKMLPIEIEGGDISYFTDDGLDEEVLSLQATGGRFLCMTCIGEYPYCEVEIYLAVAKAIAMMREEDQVLQESYVGLLEEEGGYSPKLRSLDEQLTKMFRRCRESKLEAWKNWRKSMDELPLYFQ